MVHIGLVVLGGEWFLLAEYGPALIDHMLLKVGFPVGVKLGKGFEIDQSDKLVEAFQEAEALLDHALKHPSKVSFILYIICPYIYPIISMPLALTKKENFTICKIFQVI